MKKSLAFIVIITLTSLSLFFFYPKKKSKLICEDCNLIVISFTNLRKKNFYFYNKDKATTPNLKKFFSDSFVFKNAIAPASLTFTDFTSLFYSLQPNRHKFMNRNDRNASYEILKKHKSLPLILSEKGYQTAAFVSDEDYNSKNHLGNQFQLYFDKAFYPDHQIEFNNWEYEIGTKELVKPAIKWLEENHKNKFFLFIQAYDMHCPYTPERFFKMKYHLKHSEKINFDECYITLDKVQTEEVNKEKFYKLQNWRSFISKTVDNFVLFSSQDIEYLKNLYDAELENADHNIQLLLQTIKELNLEKNTVIVFMSEHGDYLGEEGFFMKASVLPRGNLHNVNLGFPLLIKLPTSSGSISQDQMFQSIDFAPTILDLLGIKGDDRMQGKSHLDIMSGKKVDQENDYAYSFSIRQRDFRDKGLFLLESIQNQNWKLDYFEHSDLQGKQIKVEKYLFDLKNDPDEKINLYEKGNSEIFLKLNEERLKSRDKYK